MSHSHHDHSAPAPAAVAPAQPVVTEADFLAAKAAKQKAVEDARAAKAAKVAASEAAKAAKKAAAIAKETAAATARIFKEAKAEEKAKAKASRKQPEQNGIRRKRPGTKTGRIWEICDEVSARLKQPAPTSLVLEACEKEGLLATTVRCQYAEWKKFHGLTGRISLKVAAPAQPAPVAPVEAAPASEAPEQPAETQAAA